MINKRSVKQMLGEVPFTAEIYWLLRQRGRPLSRSFSLRRIQNHLPEWKQQSAAARKVISQDGAKTGKRILIFTTLRYWIEHGVLLGMALNGQGHDVTMTYLPYANWRKPLNEFDQRRQDLYARSVLDKTMPVMKSVSLYEKAKNYASSLVSPYGLPQNLAEEIEAVSVRDVQYTLQVEEIDLQSNLYHTRLRRNLQAAHAVLDWIQSAGPDRPQVILTPNGSILEMGAVYALSRYLEIPVVTYEFGEQRDRIWLAKNMEVMQQETDALWNAYQSTPLTEFQWEKIRSLFAARQGASLWENFSRRWQGQPSQGGDQVRESLGLDERPIVLLAANVIGDSLTLGRQVFSESMTEWLEKTVRYFHDKSGYQLVVRIHPGEKFTKGPSVANIVDKTCPERPDHIHVVGADDPTNTYDIVEIADLGLVYTTTTGMEMAMNGLPVIVSGKTHYRGKGFTQDPTSWEEYFQLVEACLSDPASAEMDRQQIESAWTYAYRFFFDYPLPFPWHLVHFWDELDNHSLEEVLSPDGMKNFSAAFRCLSGEDRQWVAQSFDVVTVDEKTSLDFMEIDL